MPTEAEFISSLNEHWRIGVELKKKLDEMTERAEGAEQHVKGKEQQLTELRSDLAKLGAKFQRVSRERDTLREENSNLTFQIRVLPTDDQMNEERKLVAEGKLKSSQLEKLLEAANLNSSELQSQLDGANLRSSQYEEELKAVGQKISQVEEELQAARQKISHLEDDLEATNMRSSYVEDHSSPPPIEDLPQSPQLYTQVGSDQHDIRKPFGHDQTFIVPHSHSDSEKAVGQQSQWGFDGEIDQGGYTEVDEKSSPNPQRFVDDPPNLSASVRDKDDQIHSLKCKLNKYKGRWGAKIVRMQMQIEHLQVQIDAGLIPRRFPCTTCTRVFGSKSGLYHHSQGCPEQIHLQCAEPTCPHTFTTRRAKLRHEDKFKHH